VLLVNQSFTNALASRILRAINPFCFQIFTRKGTLKSYPMPNNPSLRTAYSRPLLAKEVLVVDGLTLDLGLLRWATGPKRERRTAG